MMDIGFMRSSELLRLDYYGILSRELLRLELIQLCRTEQEYLKVFGGTF